MNRFVRPEPERRLELYEPDTAAAERQRESLARVRATRDNQRVAKALDALREAARGKENLMPLISDAVKAYASVGEICGVLRKEFGTFKEPVGL